jgi:type VI secretion system secreted protein VgrG
MSFELSFASGAQLEVRSFRVVERMSQPFSIDVVARSPDPSVDLGALVGHPARFTIAAHVRQGVAVAARSWSGLCDEAEQLAVEPAGLSTYRIHIVARIRLLDGRISHRIYTARTALEIVAELLDEWEIPSVRRVERGAYPTHVSRTQYRESDGSFFHRLLEEAGISYTFEEGTCALVLDDAPQTRAARAGGALQVIDRATPAAGQEHATDLIVVERTVSGARTLTDVDFRRPNLDLRASASSAVGDGVPSSEVHAYRPGAFAGWQEGDVGHHEQIGAFRAARELEAALAEARSVSFATDASDLAPGAVFALRGEGTLALEHERLLATELTIDASVMGDWNVRVRAVPADRPYRPSPLTPRPHIRGLQAALVVGVEGDEDVHVERHGRVRLRFPWDERYRGVDRATPWVRVAAAWAGAGFGQTLLPRVGQEVLVAFEEGDPDRPVVVGRVANATAPTPYALPGRKTESGWRSESLPTRSGYNEIRFEDAQGEELVELRAQRDARTLVRHDEAVTIGHDRTQRVGGETSETTLGRRFQITDGRREERTAVDATTVAGAGRSQLVGGEREETFEKDHTLRVDGDGEQRIAGDDVARAAGDFHGLVEGHHLERVVGTSSVQAASSALRAATTAIAAGGDVGMRSSSLVVEGSDISLSAGGSFLRIDGGGVTIHGPLVTLNEGGAPGAYVPARFTPPQAPQLPAPLQAAPSTRVVIVDETGTELTGVVDVVVGEEVILEVREDPPLHALGVQWVVEPAVDAVEDYVFDQKKGTVTKLGSLTTTRVRFFWIAAGIKRVRALVTLDGVPVVPPLEVEMNVLGARVAAASWGVGSGFALRELPWQGNTGLSLALGDPTPPPFSLGIVFIYEAQAPLGREGYLAGVQRGKVKLSAIDEDGDAWGAEWTGHWYNDSGYAKRSAYKGLYAPFNETRFGSKWEGSYTPKTPKGAPPALPVRCLYGDAPNQWIDRESPKFDSVELDYNFETFYVFKVEAPIRGGRRAIWTTVAKLKWRAHARAKRDVSGTWQIDKGSLVEPAAPEKAKGNPTLTLTAELPEWSGFIPPPEWRRK